MIRPLTTKQKIAVEAMGAEPLPIADIVRPLRWKANSCAALRFVAGLVTKGAIERAGWQPLPGHGPNSIRRRALYRRVL